MGGPASQTVIVKRQGCGSGCGTFIAVLIVIGFAYQYWFVTVPIAAIAGAVWVVRERRAQRPSATPTSPPPAGWFPDPTRRHEQRYWDGRGWTAHVSDRGVPSVAPMIGP